MLLSIHLRRFSIFFSCRICHYGYYYANHAENTGRCGSFDGYHYLYHGVHFRNAAVCAGIPFRECSGKIIGNDYHDLYGRQKRKNEDGIPLEETVVGDIVHLSAGDMVPADLRILEAKDLFISQASLTGESDPIEKTADVCSGKAASVTDFTNIAFMGSNVISGSAVGVVVAVGDDTLFGSMASSVAQEAVETNFTKGVNAVS